MMTDTIVLKVPAGTKARWVRESQTKGQKLSDWVVMRVEARPMTARQILDTISDKTGAGLTAQGFDLFPSDLISIEKLHATYDFQSAGRLLMRVFPEDAEWIERETMVEQ